MSYGQCRCGITTGRIMTTSPRGFAIWECGPCASRDESYRTDKEEYEAQMRAEIEDDPMAATKLLDHLRKDPYTAAFRMRLFGKE